MAIQRKGVFDDSAYDVFVLDEVYVTSIGMLARIKNYPESHPNKLIIAAGETAARQFWT